MQNTEIVTYFPVLHVWPGNMQNIEKIYVGFQNFCPGEPKNRHLGYNILNKKCKTLFSTYMRRQLIWGMLIRSMQGVEHLKAKEL